MKMTDEEELHVRALAMLARFSYVWFTGISTFNSVKDIQAKDLLLEKRLLMITSENEEEYRPTDKGLDALREAVDILELGDG